MITPKEIGALGSKLVSQFLDDCQLDSPEDVVKALTALTSVCARSLTALVSPEQMQELLALIAQASAKRAIEEPIRMERTH